MVWVRFIEMAEWPYSLQEAIKAGTVLLMLLACIILWRRRSGSPAKLSFGSIACTLSLGLIAVMELAAAVLRLWPYVFGWPKDLMLLGRVYEAAEPVAAAAVCAGIAGLATKGRVRWWVLLLALALVFQWDMFRAGEPAAILTKVPGVTADPSGAIDCWWCSLTGS